MHLTINKKELTEALKIYIANQYGLKASAFQFVNDDEFISAQCVKVLLEGNSSQEDHSHGDFGVGSEHFKIINDLVDYYKVIEGRVIDGKVRSDVNLAIRIATYLIVKLKYEEMGTAFTEEMSNEIIKIMGEQQFTE